MGIENILYKTKKVGLGTALALGLVSSYSGCDYKKKPSNVDSEISSVDSLGNLAWDLRNNNPDSSLKVANLELEKAREIEYAKGIADAYNTMGVIENNLGNYEKALKNYDSCLEIKKQKNDSLGIAGTFNNIASVFYEQGKYDDAVKTYFNALEIYDKVSDKLKIALVSNNLGRVFEAQEEYDKALKYYEKSLEIEKTLLKNEPENPTIKNGISSALNNIAIVFNKQNKTEKALEYGLESLGFALQTDNQFHQANCYNNLGLFYETIGELDNAINNYEKSLKVNGEIEQKSESARNLMNIGEVYRKKGDNNKSLDYLLKSEEISKEIDNPEILETIFKNFSETYKNLGEFEKALAYSENYCSIRDSLRNKESSKQIKDVREKYETEKKEQEAVKANSQKNKAYLGIGLLALGLGGLWYSRRKIKKAKQEIETQKKITEDINKILDQKNKDIDDSITYAKGIQDAILPSESLIKEHLSESFVLYKPQHIVAGDFYWMEDLEDLVIYAAADCTGHGVPGAMVSVVCNNALERSVREYGLIEPGKILDKTRELVIQRFEKSEKERKDGMDIALCSLNKKTLELQYSGANNPLYLIRNNELLETKADKQPVGVSDVLKPFTNHKVQLNKGDLIYTFSDGFADQFGGEKGKKFMSKNLKNLLIESSSKPMEKQKELLNNAIENWMSYKDSNGKTHEQIDDILIFGVKI